MLPMTVYGYSLSKEAIRTEWIEGETSEIRALDLFSGEITAIDGDAFEGLVRLETLDLSHNVLGEISVGTFSDLGSLIELNIGNLT